MFNNLGPLGLIHLAAWIYAAIKIIESRSTTGTKVFWIMLVALFPCFGLIIWYMAGPRGRS